VELHRSTAPETETETRLDVADEKRPGSPLCSRPSFSSLQTPKLVGEVEGVYDLLSTHFEALFAPNTCVLARPAAYGVHPRG
jgi:hypothetical protein